MRSNMRFTNKGTKYIVVAVFLIASVLSVFAMSKVGINYNISDYLDENTETKISLGIIEEEFGSTGDIQVMVEGVDIDTAKSIRDTIKDIPNVLTVNFDEYSENYYKNENALFMVIVDGDGYSDTAKTVLEDIKAELDESYETNYGGVVAEKKILREAMQTEIVYILGIALVLTAIIMLLTSRSWVSPIILLASSGVAVLLNMGSNIIFGEISYITNAVAAILQLALSVDYSIVLQHAFRAEKQTEEDNGKAMIRAIKSVVSPVSASALTTIAGLLALLFMSFRIGFDIGSVLMKGIVLSAITALTLFPAFLLIFDKLINKTTKKSLSLKGEWFSRLAFKGSRVIVPLALVLIVVCGVLNFRNSFSFTDSKNANRTIIENFDQNSTVIVVYPQGDKDYENERVLAEKLEAYKTTDGVPVMKSYTAYTSTVRELYDVGTAAKKLNLAEGDVEMLFGMYHYSEDALPDMSIPDFVKCADSLVESYTDSAEARDTLQRLLVVNEVMNGSHTAEELHKLIGTGVMEDTGLEKFHIEQMYGLYSYSELEDNTAEFEAVLDFVANSAENGDAAAMFDEATAARLKALAEGIDEFDAQMEKTLTQEEFRGLMYQSYGMIIDEATAAQLYAGYFASVGEEEGESITFLELMKFLVSAGRAPSYNMIVTVNTYDRLYSAIHGSYPYEQFMPVLAQVAAGLTGAAPAMNINELIVQQLYIMYFYDAELMPDTAINGREFMGYVAECRAANPVIATQLSEESMVRLSDLGVVDTFLSDESTYDTDEMSAKLEELQGSLQSFSASADIGDEMIEGVYIRYAIDEGDIGLEPIMACELLEYVSDNMDSNALLKSKMSGEAREKLDTARSEIDKATELFVGENHSRMLLSIGLPNESAESSEFIEYLSSEVKAIFGDDAHIAGEMVSTHDLQEAFGSDNKFISIFTIISIFLIVMVVFRSLSLPVILVAVIQGAIWIAMSSSLLTGSMFFMSYLMATCILMGATIDYGILMSTSYVQQRSTLDKKEALYKAVEIALPTVFTSGLILTICGFVVGIIASQTSISTVGVLLGKGTLVSVLMITLVLPSVLYLLDGFILKLSAKKK